MKWLVPPIVIPVLLFIGVVACGMLRPSIIASRHEWLTIAIFGEYQELPDTPEFHRTRAVAHDILAKTAMWWEPGYVKTLHKGEERPLEPKYFRISINEISGHQGLPAA